MLLPRSIYTLVQATLSRQAAVALIGPRHVGKTTLAHQIANSHDSLYLDLGILDTRIALENPYWFLRQYQTKLVVLDEIHRVPDLFQSLKLLLDEGRKSGLYVGRFLILGSASVGLLNQNSEAIAGNIEYFDLNPFSVFEVDRSELEKLWLRGGFPMSFLNATDRGSIVWRKNFIRTHVERAVSQFKTGMRTTVLERLWPMLAHLQGTTIKATQVARSLEISSPTVSKYIGCMEELFLVRRLQPNRVYFNKRLVRTPKVYLRDSGVLHTLLNLESMDDVLRHPVCGFSWEGFVIEHICNLVNGSATPTFFRTVDGAEIDLLLEWQRTRTLWAIEIKLSLATNVSKGFLSAVDTLKTSRNFVVCPDGESLRMSPKLERYNLYDFLQMLRQHV